jgi:hypothetical protein
MREPWPVRRNRRACGAAIPIPGHRQAWHAGRFPAHRQARPAGGQALLSQDAERSALIGSRPDRQGRGPAPTRRPLWQSGKTGSCRKIRSITSPSTCSRASRATISGSRRTCRGSAAFSPFTRHDARSGGSKPCCDCGRASVLRALGQYASRIGCCRSASDFRRLSKRETGVGAVPRAAYPRVCDKPPDNGGAKLAARPDEPSTPEICDRPRSPPRPTAPAPPQRSRASLCRSVPCGGLAIHT